jgi:hypothetical protein
VTGGRLLLAFAYEDWARENIVRAFVVAWAGGVFVWLVLDWLGNSNRGRFRPQGPRRGTGIRGRVWAWRDQRDHRDAEIRETLRAAYGKSSLRLGWSKLDETAATAHDESRLSPIPQLLEIGAARATTPPILQTEAMDDSWDDDVIDLTDTPPAADIDVTDILWVNDDVIERRERTDHDELIDVTQDTAAELIDLTDTTDHDELIDLTDTTDHDELIDLTEDTAADVIDLTDTTAQDEPASGGTARVATVAKLGAEVRLGWHVGDNPLAATLAGSAPTRTTVRSRAWKNEAVAGHGVGDENRRRMTKGRPPHRWNPITGRWEAAKIGVDDKTFIVTWTMFGVDPYGHAFDNETDELVS